MVVPPIGKVHLHETQHSQKGFILLGALKRDVLGPKELGTQRVPLGIGFFHPSGLSASLTTTYWNQDGMFMPFLDPTVPVRSGRDEFWTLDTALSYRLPKRYGFITIGATNLFDEEFKFFEVDINNSTIQPTRTVFARVTLAFP